MKHNVLLLVISLVVSLLIGEVALRLFGYDPAFVNPLNAFHEADPELGWKGVPDFSARFQNNDFDVEVTANDQGFRQKSSPVLPDKNAKSIFFLGDSFTWGWGVNNGELFTDRLQTRLGSGYDVQNYGVNAYGTTQELLLFKRLLQQGKIPDVLFLMIFQNDFSDNVDSKHLSRPYYAATNGNPTLKNLPVEKPMGGWLKDLRRKSHVLTFLSYWANYYQALRDRNALQAEVINTDRTRPSISDNSYAVMRGALRQFKSVSQANGVKLRTVYIPAPTEFASTNPPYRTAIAHISKSLGIEFLDLTPAFAESPKNYYLKNDQHWNAAGHELAATTLQKSIQ